MNPNIMKLLSPALLAAGRDLLQQGRQRRFQQEWLENGVLRLSARYSDRFNFVSKARLELSKDMSQVLSASCEDCGNQQGLCVHCAALLLHLEEQMPAVHTEASEEGAESALPAPLPEIPAAECGDSGDPRPTIRDLSYSFINCSAHLYPGVSQPEIPFERFVMVFGKTPLTRRLFNQYRRWGGSCFGMVSSTSLFQHPGNNVSVPDYRRGASIPGELQLSDQNRGLHMSLHTFIEAMQIAQMGQPVGLRRMQIMNMPLSQRLKALCEKVEAFEASGTEPVVMEVYQNQRFAGGHAILPFRHERIDSLRSRLHIYDPNVPYQVRYCDLRQDRAGNYQSWRFIMCDNTEYSSANGGVVSYLPHEIYQDAWDHRGAPLLTALFSTSCEDLTLQDEAGVDILKITEGKMTPLREDVIPVRVTDGAPEGDYSMECWIKPGSYRVINDNPSMALHFAFTSQTGEVELETEADEAVVTLDDEQNIQTIQIIGEKKSFWAKLADSVREIAIKATSTARGSVLTSVLGKLLLRNITFDSVSSFQIDGQEADVRAYLKEKLQLEEEGASEEENALLYTNRSTKNESAPEEALPGKN